jgi:hypothetical protein
MDLVKGGNDVAFDGRLAAIGDLVGLRVVNLN